MAVARVTRVIASSKKSFQDAVENASSAPARRCAASPVARSWRRRSRSRRARSRSIGSRWTSSSCSNEPSVRPPAARRTDAGGPPGRPCSAPVRGTEGSRRMRSESRYARPIDAPAWAVSGPVRHRLQVGVPRRPRRADGALREGQEPAVGHQRAHRLVAGPRPGEPAGAARRDDAASSARRCGIDSRRRRRATVRRHLQAWQLSQFLHGEQGALVCTAKIVQQVPSIDAKFYAATQVMDEARHVETYSRLLHEKFELAYPITPTLKKLLDDVLQRLALGHHLSRHAGADRGPGAGRVRLDSRPGEEPARRLGQRLRHAGRGAPRRLRPAGAARLLPAADADGARRARGVRRRGVLPDARPLPRPRRSGRRSGCRSRSACSYVDSSADAANFRSRLFTRIVPTIKDIGLWGPKIRRAYANMGILGFADVDIEALSRDDERVAEEFDQRRGR